MCFPYKLQQNHVTWQVTGDTACTTKYFQVNYSVTNLYCEYNKQGSNEYDDCFGP